MKIKSKQSLGNNIILLILLTLILKGVGFINKIIIAAVFGTTTATDIYYNASGYTDGVSSILIASLTVGIVNIYINNNNDKERNNEFISQLLVIVNVIMLFVAVFNFIAASPISMLLAPSYDSGTRSTLISAIKILSITFPFQGIIAVLSSVLQAEKKFTPVRLLGTVTSVVSILGVLILSRSIKEDSLLVSYIISIIINAILLIYWTRNIFSFSFNKIQISEDLKKLSVMVVPLLIGTAAHEVNLIIDKSVSSGIEQGAVSALSYSSTLYLFVENIIINSVVTATLPEITEHVAKKREKNAALTMHEVLYFAEVLLIPIAVCSVVFSRDITKLVYMRGSFDELSLQLTENALSGYVIGLPFLIFRDVCMNVFYAYGDTKTPVIFNLLSIVLNIILDIVLSKFLGIFGITFSTAISILFAAVLLSVTLKLKYTEYFNREFGLEFLRLLISNACAGTISFIIGKQLNTIIAFIIVAVIFIGIEICLLWLMKSRYLDKVLQAFAKKLQRTI